MLSAPFLVLRIQNWIANACKYMPPVVYTCSFGYHCSAQGYLQLCIKNKTKLDATTCSQDELLCPGTLLLWFLCYWQLFLHCPLQMMARISKRSKLENFWGRLPKDLKNQMGKPRQLSSCQKHGGRRLLEGYSPASRQTHVAAVTLDS